MVAVNMTTIESAPVFLAAQNAGDVQIELRAGGIPLLLDGTVDAATNSETQALLRSIDRPDLRIVMTVSECAYRIVARRSAGIASLADLRGKRIGTPTNTSAHYFLAKALRGAGLAESDVTIVSLPVPDMAAAIRGRTVDVVAGWEPGAHDSLVAVGADAIVFEPAGLYRELFNLNTTAAVLENAARRAALVRAVRAMIKASTQTRVDSAGVRPLLSSRIGVPEATISNVWSLFRFNATLPGDLVDNLVEEEQWAAGIQKRAPRNRAQLERLVDYRLAEDARR